MSSHLIKRDLSRDEEHHPDTKIPVVILPKDIKDLQSAVVELNLGNYNASSHYAAIAFITAFDKYVLFYRSPFNPWNLTNIHLLKKDKMDSLYMVDSNRKLQTIMNKELGLTPIMSVGKQRKRFSKTRRHKDKQRHKHNNKKRTRKHSRK